MIGFTIALAVVIIITLLAFVYYIDPSTRNPRDNQWDD